MYQLNLSRNTGYEVLRVVRTLSVVVKNVLLAVTLLLIMMLLTRFWSLHQLSQPEKNTSCTRIDFLNLATASRCEDYTQMVNLENGLATSMPNSIAQAVVISARELYYKNNSVFFNILNDYKVRVNESSIFFQTIDLRLDILKFEKQIIAFGGLDEN